jgi:putative PIN family toxin of toxin-antitoxin system
MKVKLLVVVDTNVWISAALSKTGSPAQVVRDVLTRGLPVFTHSTFDELQTRLWKPKFDRYISMDLRKRILHDIKAAAMWIDVPTDITAVAHSRDQDDDKFVHAALAANAPWLVTGDQDLLSLKPLPGLQILTPTNALKAFSTAG